ncbi:MAG: hypothetical protein RBS07_04855 [Lentimicrobium sp.]|jgi:hypothetical protein|nr:hypothetical protein [Lentimicrobium sp.]
MNTLTSTDWAAEYKSLDLDVLKRINKWMTVAIPVVGALPVAAAFLVFRHQPGVGLILMITVLIFTLRQAHKVYLLNRKPVVYSGIITGKNSNSHTNESTKTCYESFYIRLFTQEAFEIDWRGKADPVAKANKPVKLGCSPSLYKILNQGQSITVMVLPHEKEILKLFPSN